MFKTYFKRLYQRTMNEAYGLASLEIDKALTAGGECLDCGAHGGHYYERLASEIELTKNRYHGIEWDKKGAQLAQGKGLTVIQGDLNEALPFADDKFTCIFGLSVLEHLLFPCRFL